MSAVAYPPASAALAPAWGAFTHQKPKEASK
jgi:hypothetical protein